eukprot:TRINITY_DN18775_c0_g1_i2.p1 TRINITY_DN18775_c0_g1~~TRINITY_DN18775_c0_g1_i2.p1  ORF type:complete len:123 (-),score=5.11 TRINITY_DN18775_c0_g1_i2:2-370(-)
MVTLDSFVVASNLSAASGYIIVQTEYQKKIVSEWSEQIPPLETDSVHSLIVEPGYSGELKVTFTSFWDEFVGKNDSRSDLFSFWQKCGALSLKCPVRREPNRIVEETRLLSRLLHAKLGGGC